MLGTVIFLTVISSTLISVNGISIKDRDLRSIIELINRGSSSSSEVSTSDSDAADTKSVDIIKLIQEAKNLNSEKVENQKRRYKLRPTSLDQYYQNYQQMPSKSSIYTQRVNDRILEQLLQEQIGKSTKKVPYYHITPSRLLDYKQFTNEAQQEQNGLNDYSKVYMILDPVALQSGKGSESLSNLISRILLQSSAALGKSYQDKNKQSRYKGFSIKDNERDIARRFRRYSKEAFGGGGDMDDDYRPKRPRGDQQRSGGGGGGGGGRTAIPYIRHRGDIYEKDH